MSRSWTTRAALDARASVPEILATHHDDALAAFAWRLPEGDRWREACIVGKLETVPCQAPNLSKREA